MNFEDIKKLVCFNMDTLEIRESFPPLIKEILMHCWKYDAERRPTFNNLLTAFEKIKADNSLLEQKSLVEIDECFALKEPERENSQSQTMWIGKFFHEMTPYVTRNTQSYDCKKLCLIVGILLSMIGVIIFVAFLGQSVYSNNEEGFARNTSSKFFHQFLPYQKSNREQIMFLLILVYIGTSLIKKCVWTLTFIF